jgi:hypothetical protein
MRNVLLAATSMIAVSAACQQARADIWTVVFSGQGVSGTMALTA